jgi:hypothetical protein
MFLKMFQQSAMETWKSSIGKSGRASSTPTQMKQNKIM